MSVGNRLVGWVAKPPARSPSLEPFVTYLSEIAESDHLITSQSHLIEDAVAFSRLGLLMNVTESAGFPRPHSGPRSLVVEDFFQHCILDVLGVPGTTP